MSRPPDLKPLLKLLLQVSEQSTVLLDAIGCLQQAREINQDWEPARVQIVDRATELCHMAYKMAHHASQAPGTIPAVTSDAGFLPPLSPGPELDRLIYSGAMQHIADVSRFTGNLSRISDDRHRRKTARLLQEWAENLADQMQIELFT